MVWLKMTGGNGNGLYLDVYNVEMRREKGNTVYALSGTLGDGLFESSVLLEVGSRVEVTFIDEWLGREGLQNFFRIIGREELETALAEEVSAMIFCIENFPSLKGKPRNQVIGFRSGGKSVSLCRPFTRQLELPMVGEQTPIWEANGR